MSVEQYDTLPISIDSPNTPKTKKNRIEMRKTLMRFGIEASMELTINFIPSFLETSLSGRRALSALNAFRYDMSIPVSDYSNTQLMTESSTIRKSSLL